MQLHFLTRIFKKSSGDIILPADQPDLQVLLYSRLFDTPIRTDIYLPPDFWTLRQQQHPFHLLCFNDGQDLPRANFGSTLRRAHQQKHLSPTVAVGFYPQNRIEEYGTARQIDYQGRGRLSASYQRFVLEEALPGLTTSLGVSPDPTHRAFAGFSLGGLSAFDLVWNHSDQFGRVGVFSGALWWRSKKFKPKDPDADRIIHDTILQDGLQPGLKFWFQAGTRDERSDRNKNGIIDAIDDTLDAMRTLVKVGYKAADLRYEEVKGGTHDPETWGKIMPAFLKWLGES
jgi:enterochelin esterase family protein